MPDLFPNLLTYLLCGLILAGAQFLYATVGFGAGMFSIALLAMVLPDLAAAVVVVLVLAFVTELAVLLRAWRHANMRLLLSLLPTLAIGLWLGTKLLVTGDVALLKRVLGLVVLGAGAWFLIDGYRRRANDLCNNGTAEANRQSRRSGPGWAGLPLGLVSGVLGGVFGTGGPPVIIYLRARRLDKGTFRATLLWYFLLMSLFRGATYLQSGVLTEARLVAALWLLPPALLGVLLGIIAHRRISERHFATAVSVVLVLLGMLLMMGVGQRPAGGA